jgi:hypothetical protein
MCRRLLAAGNSAEELARMRIEDVPASEEKEKYLNRREELGLEAFAEVPFLVDPDGNPIPEGAVVAHLRFAKLTRISIEGNAGFCRGLLATRYGIPDPEEASA